MKKLVLNLVVSLLLFSCMAVQRATEIATPTEMPRQSIPAETATAAEEPEQNIPTETTTAADQNILTECPYVNTSDGNWERYKPSSFESLLTTVSQVSHRESNSKEGIGFYIPSADSQFPSCIRMEYKDQYREIAEPGRTFYATLGSVFNEERLQNLIENLQHEALFVENGKEYWIPVYEPLIPSMQNELERDKPGIIFLMWMGTIYVNDEANYAFYIGEFVKEE